jgi:membrane-associated phospholipid phosphatase
MTESGAATTQPSTRSGTVASTDAAAVVPWAPAQRWTTTSGDARLPTRPAVAAAARTVVAGYAAVVAVTVALGLVLTKLLLDGPVGRADDSMTRWLAEHRVGPLDSLSSWVSKSADTLGAIAIAFLIIVALTIAKRWRDAAILAGGLALELACFLTVNYFVDRPRPDVAHLGSVPSTSSFPSGHTAATMVIYGFLAVMASAAVRTAALRILAWTAAVLMPLAVGAARVYRGMHHPLDVVAGLIMGVLVLVVAFAAARAAADAARAAAPAGAGTTADDARVA